MTGSSTPPPMTSRPTSTTVHVDREAILSGVRGTDAHRRSGTRRGDRRRRCPSRHRAPRPRRLRRRGRPRSPARYRPPAAAGPQRQANGMMRAPQANAPAGARFEQPRPVPAPPPRPGRRPAPSQHFADPQSEPNGAWRPGQTAQPAGADVGRDDGQSPRHRRAFARRCPVRGQDALAARLAACDLPADPDQSRPVARRALRDGPARPDPPQCA